MASDIAAGPSLKQPGERTWIAVFIFAFLGLLVDGMDLMFLSLSLPSLMTDLGMTKPEAGTLGTISLIGMAVGGLAGGWASDRFGRVRTVVWTIMVFSLGTAALGLTHNYWQFAAVRFVSALGLGAEYAVCNTLMAEYVPTERRTTVLGTVQAGWSVGYVVASGLAGAIIPTLGWRYLFFIGLIPVVLAVLMQRYVPEPPAWQALRLKAAQSTEKPESQWAAIFSDPQSRKFFLLWSATSVFLQFGYYGVNNWLPTYLVTDMGLDFRKMTGFLVGTYTAMIVGKIVTGYLADKLGRRFLFVLAGLGTAVALPLIVIYRTPENIIALLIGFGFLYGMPYAVNATYMAESFATSIRGTAMGGSYNVGRVGAALAPTVIGIIAAQSSIGLGLAVMGGSYLLMGLVPALFIPQKMYDCQTKSQC
jgi:AAHS family cis,cis-muconate transporter-like MFS transporter